MQLSMASGSIRSAKRPACAARRGKATEAQIQAAVLQHLQLTGAKGIVFFSVPNEGKRTASTAAKLKANGLRAGVPDLMLIRDGRAYGLELKTETGRISPAQRACHAEFTSAGATVSVAFGLDDAIATLRKWGMLR